MDRKIKMNHESHFRLCTSEYIELNEPEGDGERQRVFFSSIKNLCDNRTRSIKVIFIPALEKHTCVCVPAASVYLSVPAGVRFAVHKKQFM